MVKKFLPKHQDKKKEIHLDIFGIDAFSAENIEPLGF